MKFEEFLMRPSEGQLRRLALENEVEELQGRLEGELKLNSVLRWAMKGPVLPFHCLPPELPFQVKVLLTELAVAEEQIMWLERKLRKLKLTLNYHKNNNSSSSSLRTKINLERLHNRRQSLDDRRIRSNHGGATEHTNHGLDLNLTSSPRAHGTPKFIATQLLSSPWRRNAYMCGN